MGGKSSYQFDGFEDKQDELKILKRQSSAAIELEKSIWKSCGLEKGMKVLDLGCGPGFTSCELAKVVEDGSVIGIDISGDLIAEAEKYSLRNKIGNINFMEADAYEMQLPGNSFDFAYARLLLQHLEHPGTALRNISRVLKPGGTACIVDIDDWWLKLHPEPRCLKQLLEKTAVIQKLKGGDRHVGRKLGGLLYDAGFKSISTNMILLTSGEIGMRNLLDVSIAFRPGLFPSGERHAADVMVREIYGLLEAPGASGWYGIFAATGRKD
ncbi:MAG TPA: hypothetical protein DET40_11745 [Lentisphaeria bacterium]|nr:MAG: hypothetical protein A2X45_12760 [Lentisphaerae bacterium GWF2_50_93]HCE44211.1 hypothetical protein [Lentisphaeria bacterium]